MNKELLFQLYAVHSPSGSEKKMRRFIKRYISLYCGACKVEQDKSGNILVTKGVSDTYPCLASHIDQVQRNHSKDFRVFEHDDLVFAYSARSMAMQGLGADDKNGIFICLECLRKYEVLKVSFFVGEEVGCVGSRDVDLEFFKDCRFIVQPDRRGGSDLITSMYCGEVCSQEFIRAIGADKFGYREEEGSITDVGELVERGVGISCLNLSCGYYEAHTDREVTKLSELDNCLHFVEHIVETCTDVYPFTASPLSFYGRGYRYPGHYCNNLDDYYACGYYDEDLAVMEEYMSIQPDITLEEIKRDCFYDFHAYDMFDMETSESVIADIFSDSKMLVKF